MATASIRQMLPSDPFHTSSSSKQQYHDHDSREASAGPQSPSSPQQQQQQPSSPRSSKQHKSSSNNHHAHHHGHHHGLHLHRSHHSQQQSQQHDGGANGPPEDEETMQRREQEKRSISQWEDLKRPLSPSQIAADPSRKKVGHSMSYLRVEDFALVKTLGTGESACPLHPSSRSPLPFPLVIRPLCTCEWKESYPGLTCVPVVLCNRHVRSRLAGEVCER